MTGVTLTHGLAGCGSLSVGEPDRSDLSEYDERGMTRYEKAYERSQEAHGRFYPDVWTHFDREENPGLTESEWLTVQETARELSQAFTESVDRFTEARQLSESGAFNQPALDAAKWSGLYQSACHELVTAAYWYSDDSVQELTELAEHKQAQEHVQEVEALDEPISPPELLEKVLADY